jgi:hypothetical protein
MQVHERYLGKTLRCTSCRTEFIADPADQVVEVEPATPVVVDDKHRRSPIRFFPWLLLLIPLAALLWWLGQDQSAGSAGRLFRAERSVGELADLYAGSSESVMVAFDRESVSAIVQAVERGDRDSLRALESEGRCLGVSAGTRIRVLERSRKDPEARVRIVEGPWASRIVWVPATWIR